MTLAETEAAERIAIKLFHAMPGAPYANPDAYDDAIECERQGPDHWGFCLTIAKEMVKLSGRVFVSPD